MCALKFSDHVRAGQPLALRRDPDLGDLIFGWVQHREDGTGRHKRDFILAGTSAEDHGDGEFLFRCHSLLFRLSHHHSPTSPISNSNPPPNFPSTRPPPPPIPSPT